MRIGIVDYLLRTSDDDAFYAARDVGADGIELTADQIGDRERLLFDPARPRDIIHLARNSGVAVTSLYATQCLGENLLDPDPDRRRIQTLAVEALAERGRELSCNLIVIPLLGESEPSGEHVWMALEQLLLQLTALSKKHRVWFAVKSSMRAEILAHVLRDHPAECIGASYDPSLAPPLGRDPIEEVQHFGSRLRHVHLADRTLAGRSVPLGEGDVPIRDFLESLVTRRYQGPLVLQTPSGKDPAASALRNIAYVQRMLIPPSSVEAA